jgi:hypothetical protein
MTLTTRAARRGGGLLLVGGLLLGLAACTPGGPESASDTDLTITVQVPEANYTGLTYYSLDETVYDLTPDGQQSNPLPQETQDRIIAQLRAQMTAAGYQEVGAPPDPPAQVRLIVGAVQSEVWFYYYGWGGYYRPGWYYPPYVGTGSFEVGSVLWQMLDLRNVAAGADPDPIWMAGMNGILSNSTSTNLSRLDAGISQAFRQSPYIKAGQAR